MKHTPLPWVLSPGLIIDGPEAFATRICTVDVDRPDEENKANSEFIVRAANSHNDLVEALQKALDYFQIMKDIVNSTCADHRVEVVETRTIKGKTLDEVYDEFALLAPAAMIKARGENNMVETATGEFLDRFTENLEFNRNPGETDANLRKRIMTMITEE